MQRGVSVLFLALALLFSVGTAFAYDLVGVGVWSCVAWRDARKNVGSDATEQWALGFLSGVGFVGRNGANPLKGLPPQAVTEWLDRWCRDHPNDTIAHGAETFAISTQTDH